ncbi:Membrane-associated progesterone-binding protein 4 [Linum perenne]
MWNVGRRALKSPFVGIAVLVTFTAAVFFKLPFLFSSFNFNSLLLLHHQSPQRLFTTQELSLYNGTDDSLPILLGILGSVFDVTKGKSHYGVGGSYNHFAGRDASRAFVSGNFTGDGLTDSLRDLSTTEVKGIVEWRDFYVRTYIFVGKLVGRYYDEHGNPTKTLKGVEAKAARGKQLAEKQKTEEAKQASCNSRWSQDEGGEVWCDDGYPRLVQRPLEIALTGKMSKRCACFKEEELEQTGLEVYQGCDYVAQKCQV